jgi:hypothetical protein
MKLCERCGGEYEGRANKYCDGCRATAYRQASADWNKAHPEVKRAAKKRRLERIYADAVLHEALKKKWREKSRKSSTKSSTPVDSFVLEKTAAGLKLCTACKQWLARGWFHKKGFTSTGEQRWMSHCRACTDAHHIANAAKRRGFGAKKIAPGVRRRLLNRQRGICPLCQLSLVPAFHTPRATHVDHRIALVAGGKHEEENFQLTHALCNLKKGSSGFGKKRGPKGPWKHKRLTVVAA